MYRNSSRQNTDSDAESVSSISTTSNLSTPTRTSSFKPIPDYLLFNCEIKLKQNPRDQIKDWDLVSNCAITALPVTYTFAEKGVKSLVDKVKSLKNSNAVVSDKDGLFVDIAINKRKFDLEDIKKICHNFLKYESCMDLLMSAQRLKNPDCQSNRSLFPVCNVATKNLIYECKSLAELQDLMCKKSPNYKLNLMNLTQNNTLQFRQHAATLDPSRFELWLRFVIWFVSNSILQHRSLALKPDRDKKFALKTLFQYVINESKIEEAYQKLI